jgi:Raf kinase inhibitor-like YbhB/YbcL family protein
MKLSTTAFGDGQPIPSRYARDQDGEDKSPPLQIKRVPENTRSLVLIMDDPDAPHGTFTHWILFNIDPKVTEMAEDETPASARHGMNGWGKAEYGGPKPPSGEHRYFFRLYALDTKLDLPSGASREQVEGAMQRHVLDRAELLGRYAAAQPHPAAR